MNISYNEPKEKDKIEMFFYWELPLYLPVLSVVTYTYHGVAEHDFVSLPGRAYCAGRNPDDMLAIHGIVQKLP
ncbi:hypothetical protein KQI22_11925 [Kineothrix sp. MSJ-39]|uniref:hypothetical protein n=1 Tax=Kineothrix sp. MSJ-39 TaxID=2841533 RepID=UPI001C128AB4|nr:hypothetical protein [Kineothrix sp. MSJ-39]MBU5430761.1 hypothetical protein [Kineothrix sp. MSJ-39]